MKFRMAGESHEALDLLQQLSRLQPLFLPGLVLKCWLGSLNQACWFWLLDGCLNDRATTQAQVGSKFQYRSGISQEQTCSKLTRMSLDGMSTALGLGLIPALLFQVNVMAVSICTREAYQSMKERSIDDGHIININR